MTKQTILLDLDAVLDTRLGSLSQVSPDAAVAVMRNGYWEREQDNFDVLSGGLITLEQYKTAYAKRDETTLAASVLTRLVDVLGPITQELQRKQSAQVEVSEIHLLLNFYPYKLEPATVEAFLASIKVYLAVSTQVRAVSYAPADLTPVNLDKLCDLYILYDYNEWIGLHRDALAAHPIPMTTMLAPELWHSKDALKPEYIVDKETGMTRNPFRLHQMIMAEFIGLEFHPIFLFSMVH